MPICSFTLLPGVASTTALVRDRALAALAAEFDRRLAKVTAHDRSELQRILQTLADPS